MNAPQQSPSPRCAERGRRCFIDFDICIEHGNIGLVTSPSAMRIALALLGASRGHPLTTPMFIAAAEVLSLSPNAMRIALSRLTARGDIVTRKRGTYALSNERGQAFAHVRRYRSGFATRVPWRGQYFGVLTADLPRRDATLLRRRLNALDLAGFRALPHGLFARPDNLAGGRDALHEHLSQLGLDPRAELIGVTLTPTQSAVLQRQYRVEADALRCRTLATKVEALLARMKHRAPRQVAAPSFFLGDEVLRFLARDPLLPESWASPAPRKRLADLMSRLDEHGRAVWRSLLEEVRAEGKRPHRKSESTP